MELLKAFYDKKGVRIFRTQHSSTKLPGKNSPDKIDGTIEGTIYSPFRL
jgi:hypothetical protein